MWRGSHSGPSCGSCESNGLHVPWYDLRPSRVSLSRCDSASSASSSSMKGPSNRVFRFCRFRLAAAHRAVACRAAFLSMTCRSSKASCGARASRHATDASRARVASTGPAGKGAGLSVPQGSAVSSSLCSGAGLRRCMSQVRASAAMTWRPMARILASNRPRGVKTS